MWKSSMETVCIDNQMNGERNNIFLTAFNGFMSSSSILVSVRVRPVQPRDNVTHCPSLRFDGGNGSICQVKTCLKLICWSSFSFFLLISGIIVFGFCYYTYTAISRWQGCAKHQFIV